MASANGIIRSYSAAVKRHEREQQRRTKEAARHYKLQMKEQQLQNAVSAVKNYETYIQALQSVHKDVTDQIDWDTILNEPAPLPPEISNQHEKKAIEVLQKFKPSWFDNFFGLTNKKIAKLKQNIIALKNKDLADFNKRKEDYTKEKESWEVLQKIAKGVIDKDVDSYEDAITYFDPFSEISALGSSIGIIAKSDYVIADLHVNNEEVVPKDVLTLTSTGKLSKKIMPVSKFNTLYQDYICSCALRIARETLAYLPVEFVIVNVRGEILNTITGRISEEAILSMQVYPEILEKIHFETIDPSDSMKNFRHNMKFTKTAGFMPVERLSDQKYISK